MNKPVPWNVKGVGFDAREAAREAARRAGLPVGDWLNKIISERASELGLRSDDVDSDQRLEAIAARLADLDATRSAPPKRRFENRAPALRAGARTDVGDADDQADRESRTEVRDAEQRIAGHDESQRRFVPNESILPSDAARRTEGFESWRSDHAAARPEPVWNSAAQSRASLDSLASASAAALSASSGLGRYRSGEGERKPGRPIGREGAGSDRDIGRRRSDLPRGSSATPKADPEGTRLDMRLSSIIDKLQSSFEDHEQFGEARLTAQQGERRLGRAEGALSRVSTSRPLEGAVAAISRRQSALDAASDDFSDSPRLTADLDRKSAGRRGRAGAATASGAERYADLHTAFKQLSDRLTAQLEDVASKTGSTAARSEEGPELESLQDNVAELAKYLDHMRTVDVGEQSQRSRDVELLRHEIAQLGKQLTDLSPRRSLESLENTVRDLIGRIDLSKLDGVQASILAPVERLGREMREAIKATDSLKVVDALRREVKALAGKVETWQSQGADPEILARLQAETRDMREVLAVASGRFSAVERLEQGLAALGERIDQLAERTTPAMSRGLSQATSEIRALLKQLESDGVLGAIDRKIDALTARVDGLSKVATHGDMFDDLTRQIDRAHESLSARLASHKPQQLDLTALEERIGALSAKFDTFNRASHDVNALYGLVGGLADRIEDARHSEADPTVLTALQAQITRLVERLDRSDDSQATLAGLERSIGDLFLHIEQTRNVAIDAAENAARTAAQDTLRAAMDNPTLNGGELTVQTGLDVDHVSQELAELRRAHETSDRRVNATLIALNTTLERLVDRMVADRPPQPAVAPEAAAALKAEKALPIGARPGKRRPPRGLAESIAPLREREPSSNDFDPETFLLEPSTVGPSKPADRMRPPLDPASARVPAVDIGKLADEPRADVAPLIAAARRAAKAAQASAMEASLNTREPPAAATAMGGSKTRSYFAQKRRPLLLGLAGLVLLIGALQIVKLSSDKTPAEAGAAQPPLPPAVTKPETHTEAAPAQAEKAAPAATASAASLIAPPDSPSAAASGFTKPAAGGGTTLATGAGQPVAADPVLNGLGQGLRDLASGGNAAAQFEVAVRLLDGRDVARDPARAAIWFQRAAQQGLAPAQYRLGSLYEKGIGVAVDPALAMAWYGQAADQGNIRAMHNLAVMSAEGAGSKPDYAKAVAWFTKAADYGVRDSQFNLAVLYARGLGVPQNLGQSYSWFAIAAAQGDNDALQKRDSVAGKLDAKGLADAKAAVDSFRPLPASPGANDVAPPPGGWDAVAPAKTALGDREKYQARLSSNL